MKKLLALSLIFSLSTACAYSNRHGHCIGVTDTPDPNLQYGVSGRNIFWTFIGSASIIVPVIWIFTCVRCPTGPAPEQRSAEQKL